MTETSSQIERYFRMLDGFKPAYPSWEGDPEKDYQEKRVVQAILDLGVSLAESVVQALVDHDERMNYAAQVLIPELRHDRQLPELLIEHIKNPNPDVRMKVLNALDYFHTLQNIQAVTELLNDPEPHIRYAAVRKLSPRMNRDMEQLLIAFLTHPETEMRLAAVKGFASDSYPQAVEVLTDLLDDAYPEIRRLAVEGLGRIDHPQVLKRLATMLDDPEPDVCEAAIWAIAKIANSRSIEVLVQFLERSDHHQHSSAIAALAHIGTPAVVDTLIAMLTSPHEAVRKESLDRLAQIHDMGAVEAITFTLKDKSSSIRLGAVEALRRLRASNTAPALVPLLEDEDSHVQHRTAYILRDMDNPEIAAPIAEMVKSAIDSRRRAYAIIAIGQINTVPVIDLLITALHDSNSKVRLAAIEGLSTQTDPRIQDALTFVLNDAEPDVRIEAATALARQGDQQGINALIDMLMLSDRGSPYARSKALDSLIEKESAIVPRLIEIARTGDKEIRQRVIWLMSDICDKQFANLLVEYLDDSIEFIRLLAELETGRLQGSGGLDHLLKVMRSSEPALVSSAIRAIQRIPGKEAITALVEAIGHADENVVRTAEFALKSRGLVHVSDGLIAVLDKPDFRGRWLAIHLLRFMHDPYSVEPLIKILKNENDSKVRYWAASALDELQDMRAQDVMLATLSDPNVDVRRSGIRSMRWLRDPAAIELLLGMLNSRGDHQISDIVWALEAIGDARAIEPLKALLLSDRVGSDCGIAMLALDKIGGAAVAEFLLTFWQGREPSIRDEVVKTLAYLGKLHIVDELLRRSQLDDPAVQITTLELMWNVKDDRIYETIRAFTNNPNMKIREAANKALKLYRAVQNPAD